MDKAKAAAARFDREDTGPKRNPPAGDMTTDDIVGAAVSALWKAGEFPRGQAHVYEDTPDHIEFEVLIACPVGTRDVHGPIYEEPLNFLYNRRTRKLSWQDFTRSTPMGRLSADGRFDPVKIRHGLEHPQKSPAGASEVF